MASGFSSPGPRRSSHRVRTCLRVFFFLFYFFFITASLVIFTLSVHVGLKINTSDIRVYYEFLFILFYFCSKIVLAFIREC